jgi:hypothetical protein
LLLLLFCCSFCRCCFCCCCCCFVEFVVVGFVFVVLLFFCRCFCCCWFCFCCFCCCYEGLKRSIYNCNANIHFNRKCLRKNVISNFAKIKIPNSSPAF